MLANLGLHPRAKFKCSSYGKYLPEFCYYLHLALFILRSRSLSLSHLTGIQRSWWPHSWADVRNLGWDALVRMSERLPCGILCGRGEQSSLGTQAFPTHPWELSNEVYLRALWHWVPKDDSTDHQHSRYSSSLASNLSESVKMLEKHFAMFLAGMKM